MTKKGGQKMTKKLTKIDIKNDNKNDKNGDTYALASCFWWVWG